MHFFGQSPVLEYKNKDLFNPLVASVAFSILFWLTPDDIDFNLLVNGRPPGHQRVS